MGLGRARSAGAAGAEAEDVWDARKGKRRPVGARRTAGGAGSGEGAGASSGEAEAKGRHSPEHSRLAGVVERQQQLRRRRRRRLHTQRHLPATCGRQGRAADRGGATP